MVDQAHEHGATDQAAALEIVVDLLRAADRM